MLLGLSGDHPHSPSLMWSLLLSTFGTVLAILTRIHHGIGRLPSCCLARSLGFWTPSGVNRVVSPPDTHQVLRLVNSDGTWPEADPARLSLNKSVLIF